MDAVSDTSSVDIEAANETVNEEGGRISIEVRGEGSIAVEEQDDNDDDDDDMATDTDEEEEDGNDDDVTDSSSDEEEEEEEEELEEEDLDIPTPEEVEIEYTFPQDFDVHRSWRDIFLSPPWFGRRGEFFRLIIDPSCRKIPSGFFWQCTYLIEIVFPEKNCLAEIGQEAFFNCENLQRMNAFPVGLLRLRPRAFSWCISLSGELVIPCTVVLMDHLCFFGCEAVTSFVFRDNLTQETDPVKLGNYVFANCSDLQSVRLPQNIVLIPPGAFSLCTALRNIPLPVSVEEIGIEAFLTCSSLPSVDLPERTSRIGSRAYGQCSSLVQVTIRATGVLYCGRAIFTHCLALVSIQVYPSVWTTLFESMNEDPSFLFYFIRTYQSYKWTPRLTNDAVNCDRSYSIDKNQTIKSTQHT